MRFAALRAGPAVFTVLFLLIFPAWPAEIVVHEANGADRVLVTIVGELVLDDYEKFNTQTSQLTKALVMLSSDGGNLWAGLQIGTQIRLKGFWTVVPDNIRCASACALAWLGGAERYMGPDARIGFHAASIVKDGVNETTSAGNALMGAYLNRIGLPDKAVIFITNPPPNEIAWLNINEASNLGIDVRAFRLPSPAASPPEQSPSQEAALSEDDQVTAIRLTRNFRKRLDDAGVGGLGASVQACYDVAGSTEGDSVAVYCLALDLLVLRWNGHEGDAKWRARADGFLDRKGITQSKSQLESRAAAVANASLTQLSPSQSARLSLDDQVIASRLTQNFRRRLREAGVPGLRESVFACYQQAGAAAEDKTAVYCIALDLLALKWSGRTDDSAWKARADNFLRQTDLTSNAYQLMSRASKVVEASLFQLRH